MSRTSFPVLSRIVWAALVAALTFTCTGGSLKADDAKGIAKHPFVKLLIGEWEATGELKGQDGNVITVKEEWTARVDSENTFTIEGKRELNADKSDYKWTVTFHPDTGVYEAMHVINSGEAQRFEGSFTEGSLSVEWTAQMDGGASIKLLDAFTGEERDTFDTDLTMTNGKGETTLSGKIVNKRVKKA
ncbi:MAG TPA: hypothetical protein VLE43_19725 [Candidatus Saccharimonadia bacterium]|nr:hypothetical protein [Candidatus Saccharimonadia bacterium]